MKTTLFTVLAGMLLWTGCGDDKPTKKSSKSPDEEMSNTTQRQATVELKSTEVWRPTLSLQPWHLNRIRWENAQGNGQAVLKAKLLGYIFPLGQPAIRGYTYGYESLQKEGCQTSQAPQLNLSITVIEGEKKTLKPMKLNEQVDLGSELHAQHEIVATITNPGNCASIVWAAGILAHQR